MKSLFVAFTFKSVEDKTLHGNKTIPVSNMFFDITDQKDITFLEKKIETENAVREVKISNWKWLPTANIEIDPEPQT